MNSESACQVAEGVSGRVVRCDKPAVATLTYAQKSYRACERHAARAENLNGLQTVKRDS